MTHPPSETKIKPQPDTDIGSPNPALIVFLILPLVGILVALAMLAVDLRQQRLAAQQPVPIIEDDLLRDSTALVNNPAPEFELPLLSGGDVSIADYEGKTLFLNFWYTDCPPCVEEMPEFEQFIRDQNPDEVALLAINVEDSADDIRKFFAEIGVVGIPTALDTNAVISRDYGVLRYPVTFVINPEGIVRFMNIGALRYDDMEEYVELVQTTSVGR